MMSALSIVKNFLVSTILTLEKKKNFEQQISQAYFSVKIKSKSFKFNEKNTHSFLFYFNAREKKLLKSVFINPYFNILHFFRFNLHKIIFFLSVGFIFLLKLATNFWFMVVFKLRLKLNSDRT